MKNCSKCKEEKELSCFTKDSYTKTGFNSSCKECEKKRKLLNTKSIEEKEKIAIYQKEYRNKNVEIRAIKNKEYREKNKESLKEKDSKRKKEYYAINKEKINSINRKYYSDNELKESERKRKFYIENKENIIKKCILYRKKRLKIDSLYKFNIAIRCCIGRSFKRGKNNFTKNISSEDILCISVIDFIAYIESLFTEGMSLSNHGIWHLDHIVPLNTAKTEDDIIRLNHYTNFQPLWAKDNLKKGSKIIDYLK